MRHEVRSDAAIGEIYQVESRGTRVQGEIRDADEVAVRNAVAMSFQGLEGSLQQTWSDLWVCGSWSWRPFQGGPGQCRRGQTEEGACNKKTARKYQDLELRRG